MNDRLILYILSYIAGRIFVDTYLDLYYGSRKKTTFSGTDFRRKSQSIKIKLVDIINVKFTEKKLYDRVSIKMSLLCDWYGILSACVTIHTTQRYWSDKIQ